MTNEQMKAYMLIVINSLLNGGVIKQSGNYDVFGALEWTLNEMLDTYTPEQAIQKSNMLRKQ